MLLLMTVENAKIEIDLSDYACNNVDLVLEKV